MFDKILSATPLVGTATDLFNTWQNYQQWQDTKAINQQNYQYQKERDQKNFRFQNAQWHYQKDLQEQMFQREDNAVQRRALDLQAAGINPILASGQAANAGQEIKVDAPQHGEVRKDVAQRPTIADMAARVLQYQALKKGQADISRTEAENKLLRQQSGIAEAQEKRIKNQSWLDYLNAKYREKELEQFEETGIGNSSSVFAKMYRDIVSGTEGGASKSLIQKLKELGRELKNEIDEDLKRRKIEKFRKSKEYQEHLRLKKKFGGYENKYGGDF